MRDEHPYPDDVGCPDRVAPAGFAAYGDESSSGIDGHDLGDPGKVLRRLLDGNHRFRSGLPRHGHDVAEARSRAERPRPVAVVVGCIDSRVPPEAVFDQGFGDLLVVRTAGHVLDSAATASVELAVGRMGVALVVVLGHEGCAAVGYAVDAVHRSEHPGGDLGYLVDKIAPSVPMDERLTGTETYDGAVRAHLSASVAAVRTVPTVTRAIAAGTVAVAGIRYGITDGGAELVVPPG